MQFGWKAIATTVNQQSANAYLDDMGLTTATEPRSTMATDGSPADISWENLDGLSYYTQTLAAHATDKASHNLLGHRDQHSLINFKVLAVTCPASGQGTINRQWQKSSRTKQSGLTPTFYFAGWGLASKKRSSCMQARLQLPSSAIRPCHKGRRINYWLGSNNFKETTRSTFRGCLACRNLKPSIAPITLISGYC